MFGVGCSDGECAKPPAEAKLSDSCRREQARRSATKGTTVLVRQRARLDGIDVSKGVCPPCPHPQARLAKSPCHRVVNQQSAGYSHGEDSIYVALQLWPVIHVVPDRCRLDVHDQDRDCDDAQDHSDPSGVTSKEKSQCHEEEPPRPVEADLPPKKNGRVHGKTPSPGERLQARRQRVAKTNVTMADTPTPASVRWRAWLGPASPPPSP